MPDAARLRAMMAPQSFVPLEPQRWAALARSPVPDETTFLAVAPGAAAHALRAREPFSVACLAWCQKQDRSALLLGTVKQVVQELIDPKQQVHGILAAQLWSLVLDGLWEGGVHLGTTLVAAWQEMQEQAAATPLSVEEVLELEGVRTRWGLPEEVLLAPLVAPLSRAEQDLAGCWQLPVAPPSRVRHIPWPPSGSQLRDGPSSLLAAQGSGFSPELHEAFKISGLEIAPAVTLKRHLSWEGVVVVSIEPQSAASLVVLGEHPMQQEEGLFTLRAQPGELARLARAGLEIFLAGGERVRVP